MGVGFKEDTFKLHREELLGVAEDTPFIVFLCGPAIKDVINDLDNPDHDEAAVLRAKIKLQLEENGFEVVLGEDEGLEDPRLEVGRDSQDNELQYIAQYCDAVVIVTGKTAIGAFCELGLFSWHFVHSDGTIKKNGPEKDFILIVDEEYRDHKSYFNEGPASIVSAFGRTEYVNYGNYDIAPLIKRFRLRKAMIDKDRRGRPRSNQ